MSNKKIEFIGYAATFFLIISFMLDDFFIFRLINSIGAVLFIIYGLLKKAPPVTITNVLILLLNIYYILRHYIES